jgi:hypothetical protein
VTEEEYRADGFTSREDLLSGMKKYYPNLTLESPITVIRWENARGWWVDHKEQYGVPSGGMIA